MGAQAEGGTLAPTKGSPESLQSATSATIDRAAALVAAATALGASLLALTLSLGGTVDPGAVADDPGGEVRDVTPGGLAWNSGIRPKQQILALTAADDPAGWSLATTDGGRRLFASAAAGERALRASWALALLAAAAAVGAIVSLRRASRSTALAALAWLLALVPARVQGDAILAAIMPVAVAVVPAVWLARWAHGPRRWLMSGIGVLGVTTLGWLWARDSRAEAFSSIDVLQLIAVIAAVGFVLANEAGVIGARRMLTSRVRAVDIALVGALLALAVLLLVIGDVEPVYVGIGLAVLIGIYAPVRRAAARALDGLLLADVRDRTSIRATEEERARLARDLHDAPLQELAGVIQRLELLPEARGEGDRLRTVASQLRAVATDLHPPVLDDLGLVAALKFLGDHPPVAGSSSIEVSVEGAPSLRAERRPPSEVEIAAFRIIQEALANALRHSGAPVIRVGGAVGRDHILLTVQDDGSGMSGGTRLEALQRGRLGLDSMHRRADAAGAVLRIRSAPGAGTTVEFDWRR